MQKVSKEYRESMKSSLREQGYIKVTFGLFTKELQKNATVDEGDYTYFSVKDGIFREHDVFPDFATLEENFTKVDGSMRFLPRYNPSLIFDQPELVSNQLVSNARCEVVLRSNLPPMNFMGMTINFGENYPVDFDVVSNGRRLEVRGNTKSEWITEEVFEHTTVVTLIFYRMKNPQSRLRIHYIMFGHELIYDNDSVIESKLDSYVSPIGADVPQIDFSVQIKNYDHYFNVDNPKSAINYLETGQDMEIMYGYRLPNSKIEWIQGGRLLCSGWESDDNTATIRCQDIFRTMDSEYTKGQVNVNGLDPRGTSYYQLAEDVLQDAGITDYHIDPCLKDLFSNCPIPRVKHKEALQIIANACRCTLSQSRYGKVVIKSNFPSGARVDLGDSFIKENGRYVSKSISDGNGKFDVNPILTINFDATRTYYGMKLVFGESLPSLFSVGTATHSYGIGQDDIHEVTVLEGYYEDTDKIIITFKKTANPNSQIVLDSFEMMDTADFTMFKDDMTTSPKTIKQELVKEIIVPCYQYNLADTGEEENLLSEDITVNTEGEEITYYFQDACYGYRALLNGEELYVEVGVSGSFYVKLRFLRQGKYKLDIQGHRFRISEKYAIKYLNPHGKTIKWDNPLISKMSIATALANWLGSYYNSDIEYEYDTRGNPELDTGDVIYQENEFKENMRVNIYRQSTIFKQSFAGKVTAHRIGG